MRAVVEVPVLVGKLSEDPALADSVVRDGSADLVGLNEALRGNSLWPQEARTTLMRADEDSMPRPLL
jgi:2,4-dienoyl-CoA reductase-like NADH-dependent reductase (Old Yellow Enzyme family)